VHQIACLEAGGGHGAGGTPVVGGGAFGFVDGAGRLVNTACAAGADQTFPADGGKAPERIGGALGLLACQQFVFARDRQLGQCSAAGDAGGVDPFQDFGKGGAVLLRVGNLRRQRGHQGGFAFLRAAGFKGVVVLAHGVCDRVQR